MNSRLASRMDRVVRERKRRHPCQLCHGKGRNVVTYQRNGEETVPDPDGCPNCGEVFHIVVRYVHVPIITR